MGAEKNWFLPSYKYLLSFQNSCGENFKAYEPN